MESTVVGALEEAAEEGKFNIENPEGFTLKQVVSAKEEKRSVGYYFEYEVVVADEQDKEYEATVVVWHFKSLKTRVTKFQPVESN